MDSNKDRYIDFCKNEENISIFSQYWWLDSVCGKDNWDVALVENQNNIIASMPYYYIKKGNFLSIDMPPFTQVMGPYIKYPQSQKYNKKLSFEKKVMNVLISKLPKFDEFHQRFDFNITNWLPFYWNGYKQTTRYSYVIENFANINDHINAFSSAKKKNIKKAEKILEVKFDLSAKEFYDNHKMTLAKQGLEISYSLDLFKNIYMNGYKNDSVKTIYAVDKENNIHAALFIIWDNNTVYDLISTIDPTFRNSGSGSLLIKEAIKFASTKTNKFDFEGSMIENVENSFRQFGAIQQQYFEIRKVNPSFNKTKNILKELYHDLF